MLKTANIWKYVFKAFTLSGYRARFMGAVFSNMGRFWCPHPSHINKVSQKRPQEIYGQYEKFWRNFLCFLWGNSLYHWYSFPQWRHILLSLNTELVWQEVGEIYIELLKLCWKIVIIFCSHSILNISTRHQCKY